MRALILADRVFAMREREMLARVEIGLVDEGVRVVHAVPRECLSGPEGGLYTAVVGYRDSGWAISRRSRATELARAAMEKLRAGERDRLDIVHVFGENAWPFGLDLARATDATPVLEVSNYKLVSAAKRLATQVALAHKTRRPVLLAPDAVMQRALGKLSRRLTVVLAPWGVRTPPETRPPHPSDAALSLAVHASGMDAAAVVAVLEAIRDLAADHPTLHAIFPARCARRAPLWREATRLGVRDRLVLIEGFEARRDPILEADMMLLPDADGRHHSITLDAMARGVPVVAREDRRIGTLIDGRTALLVGSGSPAEWAQSVRGLLADRAEAAALAASARDYVREHHPVSGQVAAILGAYQAAAASRSAEAAGVLAESAA